VSAEMVRLEAIVSGRVQGVGYRFYTVNEATERNLAGFCRNLPDGTVEVVAEGPRSTLEDFLHALRRGPRSGHVDGVAPSWGEATGESESFGVR
jgi:acylphosphatase